MANPLIREDKDYTINPDFPLKGEQQDSVEFLLEHFYSILALQTGFGKTYVSLTAAQHCHNYSRKVHTVIICPKAANVAFKKELEQKIMIPYSIHCADETKEDPEARYHIFNHTSIHKHVEKIKEMAKGKKLIVIIDEGHILQNPSTRVSKALKELRPYFACRWILTATPLLNHIEGLYHVVNFVVPGFLGTYSQFKAEYLITRKRTITRGGRKVKFDEILDYKNIDKLHERLRSVVIVKKIEYNVNFKYLRTEMSEEESENYTLAGKGIIQEGYDEQNEKDFGARLHDLQRVVDNAYEGFQSSGLSNKEKLMLNTIHKVVKKDQSILIYVDYDATQVRLSEIIEKYRERIGYKNFYLITGKVDFQDRIKVEKDLGSQDVVLLTRAGSQSINLQAANNVAFYDIPFSIGWFIQVIGRITRVNTEYNVQNIFVLEVKDTIDTYKRILVEDNAKLIKDVFGGNSNLPKNMNTLDKKNMNFLRQKLLWRFQGKGPKRK